MNLEKDKIMLRSLIINDKSGNIQYLLKEITRMIREARTGKEEKINDYDRIADASSFIPTVTEDDLKEENKKRFFKKSWLQNIFSLLRKKRK
jgi:hypothetical protein